MGCLFGLLSSLGTLDVAFIVEQALLRFVVILIFFDSFEPRVLVVAVLVELVSSLVIEFLVTILVIEYVV